jgi:hypothetical protein
MHPRSLLVVSAFALCALAGCGEQASVAGESGARLTLEKPASVTLRRGGMTKAEVRIGRRDLAGEVAVRFSNLPKGVDVVDADSRIVGDHGSYTLRASADADLVEKHAAEVTVTGGPGNISVTQSIDIDVRPAE